MSAREFIVLIALVISIVAVSIDAMLPALGIIGGEFRLSNPNHAQYVIAIFFAGLAVGQLVCGPVSDAMGRKAVLFAGTLVYLAGSAICFVSNTFEMLLIGRLVQGLGVAGPYVTAVSVVRDKFSGREMAQIMSVVMMFFILVPALAPSMGQGIMLIASWRYIFVMYVAYATLICLWIAFRLEETLPPERRIPLSGANMVHGFMEIIRNRTTMSYMLCNGISFGAFTGYLNSSQQIFHEYYSTGKMFSIYFGLLALVLGIASLMNSRFVQRYGMRPICLYATFSIVAASAVFFALNVWMTHVPLWIFLTYAATIFFGFGLMFGNLNAVAMEPMGKIAGIAAALIGSAASMISLVLGAVIGQLYNNTLLPMTAGFLILCSLSYAIMRWENQTRRTDDEDEAERGIDEEENAVALH